MSDTQLAATGLRSMCTFLADKRRYCIEVAYLREISTSTVISPIPQAPACVRGLLNLRSRVLLIVDFRPLVGLSPIAVTPEHRLLILKSQVLEDAGILIDSGGDIVQVSGSRIEILDDSQAIPPDAGGLRNSPLVTGICKLESELLMIVDPTRISEMISAAIR